MEHILISIILPVYNAGRYIARSIESVTAQMCDDMELILVDDGSTDDSGAICDCYAAENPRIRVIHQRNAGVSAARNTGLDQARGEYLSFVDSDDTVEPFAYEKIRQIILAHHPDVLDFGWKYVTLQGDISRNHHQLPKNTLLGEDVVKDRIIPSALNLCEDKAANVFPFLWNKLFKRSVATENGVRFLDKCRVWADKPFVMHFLKYCRSYYSMEEWLYNYHGVPDSLSVRYNLRFFDIIQLTYEAYVQWYGELYDLDTPYANRFYCQTIEKMVFRSLEQEQDKETIAKNIVSALSHPQVIHWYANSAPRSSMEKKIAALVADHCPEQALQAYIKAMGAKKRKKRLNRIKAKVRRIVRR